MTNEIASSASAHLLVIAYGNVLRRDDGAGIELAKRIVERWQAQGICLRYIITHQLLPELALQIAEPDVSTVIFVDTSAESQPTMEIRIRCLTDHLSSPSLGHQLDPAGLMVYAHHLYNHQPAALLVTLPGTDFGYGMGFSPVVRQMLDDADGVADRILLCVMRP